MILMSAMHGEGKGSNVRTDGRDTRFVPVPSCRLTSAYFHSLISVCEEILSYLGMRRGDKGSPSLFFASSPSIQTGRLVGLVPHVLLPVLAVSSRELEHESERHLISMIMICTLPALCSRSRLRANSSAGVRHGIRCRLTPIAHAILLLPDPLFLAAVFNGISAIRHRIASRWFAPSFSSSGLTVTQQTV